MEINEVELACKLADIKVKEELLGTELKYKTEEDLVYNIDGDLYYKEEVQEVFNRWYDYYWDLIIDCKPEF